MKNVVKLFGYGFLAHAMDGVAVGAALVSKTALILYTRAAIDIDGPLPSQSSPSAKATKEVN